MILIAAVVSSLVSFIDSVTASVAVKSALVILFITETVFMFLEAVVVSSLVTVETVEILRHNNHLGNRSRESESGAGVC